jgi:hypothetical protein
MVRSCTGRARWQASPPRSQQGYVPEDTPKRSVKMRNIQAMQDGSYAPKAGSHARRPPRAGIENTAAAKLGSRRCIPCV